VSDKSEAWSEAADLAEAYAGYGYASARDRGVPAVRVEEMRTALRLLKAGDPDAFYAAVSIDYAAPAAGAVAQAFRMRAEDEERREAPGDPTDPVQMVIPPEAKP
jgi:hypothetical protein